MNTSTHISRYWIISLFLFLFFISPITIDAQDAGSEEGLSGVSLDECKSLGIGCPPGVATPTASTVKVWGISIINIFLGLTSLIALIMIIIAAVIYITSLGDDQKLQQAKTIILYAIIGLIIIGLAAVVVNFVITAVSTS